MQQIGRTIALQKLISRLGLKKWEELGFTMVPNQIIKGSGLTNSEMRVYATILMRTFNKGQCRVSHNTIAKDIGLNSKNSRITILNNIKKIVKKGFLESQRATNGSVCVYRPLVFVDKTGVVDRRVNKNSQPL
ncbi:MAG: hypothetical protein UW46_C0005G0046 [Candidatus Yanofskybacteria bacterium GW2011_GWF1_44_227]|uniref:Uncharacterized protein n=1 Tax=Candidatus Yanofskybacteria bacterium GW2011_GWE2_40_11 TaxID=1619033 RepID=A0A0G0QKQ9_9BACT|nr:MAG: hypothetical protein UT69_C0018G0007 [Candidatus Yanofskybacteria bacterium GW2011_GWE1_40_10]KKR41009.1 MAG: hypothetical protein UT75_C0002G0046 [Candidatus Yanofskybacteria bacterium GW2011_GWE2_40_11]KKT15510.1 MAG: hypothetical protein UV97_C0005G0003 [Candidatus Yanofskybacteria bacterium GW2011_GWF2_43_596]KKT53240.1 MAG: hypothetical protein UW46_C0005G0046 [Candidatus Yanofskybacteria bacterium GW2011_GWF1_44_227]OGN35553.1 MAG: hypothetical protein A2207_02315 [Candidatus Yano